MEPLQAQTPPVPQVRQTTPHRAPPRHQEPAPIPTAARADPVARGGPAEAQVAADTAADLVAQAEIIQARQAQARQARAREAQAQQAAAQQRPGRQVRKISRPPAASNNWRLTLSNSSPPMNSLRTQQPAETINPRSARRRLPTPC